MDTKLEQLVNAEPLIVETPSGMFTSVKPEEENAESPIDVTELEIVAVVKAVKEKKAKFHIDVTPSSIKTVLISVLLLLHGPAPML